MHILPKRNSIAGLLFYYLSLLAFTVSCINYYNGHTQVGAITFILTLLAMLIQDADWLQQSRIHPHDKQLIEELTDKLMSDNANLFLKEHDFVKLTYTENNLKSLIDIHRHWHDIDHQFVNRKYQTTWQAMQKKLDELLDLLLKKSSNKGMNFYHMLPPPDKRHEYSDMDQRLINAKTANALARDIYNNFQQFRHIYQTKMQRVKV